MTKILIVCNSAYQLIVALHLQISKYPNATVDLMITDYIRNSEVIAKRAKLTKHFNQVFNVSDAKNYSIEVASIKKISSLYYSLFPKKLLDCYVSIKSSYDVLMMANFNPFSELIVRVLKRNWCVSGIGNRNLIINMIEDGTATYTKIYKDFYEKLKIQSYSQKLLALLFKSSSLHGNVDCLYVFNPNFMCWKPPFKVSSLPKIDSSQVKLKNILNTIFNYDEERDCFAESIIFFEDTYNSRGYQIDDLEILNQIVEVIDKKEVMVKIHPRSSPERFLNNNYKTNHNLAIPFELYIMNEDLSNRIFITIGSGSASNTVTIFNQKVISISLLNCLKQIPELLQGELQSYIKILYAQYDHMFIPNNINETIAIIKREINQIK